jgi:hypothetical protein
LPDQGILQLLGKETLALHFSKCDVLDTIAAGFYDFDGALDAKLI